MLERGLMIRCISGERRHEQCHHRVPRPLDAVADASVDDGHGPFETQPPAPRANAAAPETPAPDATPDPAPRRREDAGQKRGFVLRHDAA